LPPDDAVYGYLADNNKTQETSKIPLVKSNLFQRIKIPPYVVVSNGIKPTTYSGRKSRFSYAAVFKAENEERINGNISVGCNRKS